MASAIAPTFCYPALLPLSIIEGATGAKYLVLLQTRHLPSGSTCLRSP
jgi:hypothetical protein